MLFASIKGVFAMHLTSWRLSCRSRSQLLWPPMQLGGISMVCKLQAWAGAWLLKSTSFLLAWMLLVSHAATLASLLPFLARLVELPPISALERLTINLCRARIFTALFMALPVSIPANPTTPWTLPQLFQFLSLLGGRPQASEYA